MNINWKTLNIFFMGDFNDHKYQLISRNSKNQFIKFLNTTLYVDDGDGGTDHYIYKTQALGANETFEHTGRIVLEATDVLYGIAGGSADIDVFITYLDQTL